MANQNLGKCNNFSNCTKADSNEEISYTLAQPTCPECGMPLVIKKNKKIAKVVFFILPIFLVMAWGGYYIIKIPRSEQDVVINNCTPLLIEGKKSLYQRVVTKPKAHKTNAPGGSGEATTPFTPFYVYGKKTFNNEEWLEIGFNNHCGKSGWIKAADSIEWKQQLSLTLTNPAAKNRQTAYFFSDKQALEAHLYSQQLLSANAVGVVATEPEYFVDPDKTFYLMPVLDFYTNEDDTIKLLKVATATLEPNSSGTDSGSKAKDNAVVFVVDTTISMKPYIQEVKKTVEKIYEQFKNSPLREHVKFGFIGFRSNIRFKPELGYVYQVFVDPAKPDEEENFLKIVDGVDEATVSSKEFHEDSYAGVLAAVNQIFHAKNDFLGKQVVLITDASAIEPEEKLPDGTRLGAADLSAESINGFANQKDINIYAFHLRTPAGLKENDHGRAASQYKLLTKNTINSAALYYTHSIEKGQTDLFGDALGCLVQSWTGITISLLGSNNRIDQTDASITQYCPSTQLENANPEQVKQKGQLRNDIVLLGHALRLKYLGSENGTQVPEIIQGWINDKENAQSASKVQVNVLLSRSELHTLAEKIAAIVNSYEQANASETSQAQLFFTKLRETAAKTVRDPNLTNDASVAEVLALDELLDLPYKSPIMNITPESWRTEWSRPDKRITLMNSLSSKLNLYRQIQSDSSRWHDLNPANNSDIEDQLTLLPIDSLP